MKSRTTKIWLAITSLVVGGALTVVAVGGDAADSLAPDNANPSVMCPANDYVTVPIGCPPDDRATASPTCVVIDVVPVPVLVVRPCVNPLPAADDAPTESATPCVALAN